MFWYCDECGYANGGLDTYCCNCHGRGGGDGNYSSTIGISRTKPRTKTEFHSRVQRYHCCEPNCDGPQEGFSSAKILLRHRIQKHEWTCCEIKECQEIGIHMAPEDFRLHQISTHSYVACPECQCEQSNKSTLIHPQLLSKHQLTDHGCIYCPECSLGPMSPMDLISHKQLIHNESTTQETHDTLEPPEQLTSGALRSTLNPLSTPFELSEPGIDEPSPNTQPCRMCNILAGIMVSTVASGTAVGLWRSAVTGDEGKGFTDAAFVVAAGGALAYSAHMRHAPRCRRGDSNSTEIRVSIGEE